MISPEDLAAIREAMRWASDQGFEDVAEEGEAALKRLLEQYEVAEQERVVAQAEAGHYNERNAELQEQLGALTAFLTNVTWAEDMRGDVALSAEDFEKLRQLLLHDSNPASEPTFRAEGGYATFPPGSNQESDPASEPDA